MLEGILVMWNLAVIDVAEKRCEDERHVIIFIVELPMDIPR